MCTDWGCIPLYHHNPQENEDNDNKWRKPFIKRVIFILAQNFSKPVKYKYNDIGINTVNFISEFPTIMM